MCYAFVEVSQSSRWHLMIARLIMVTWLLTVIFSTDTDMTVDGDMASDGHNLLMVTLLLIFTFY